jgi:DASS family divalent anion:Na+ symporter
MGELSGAEKKVLLTMGATVLLWMFGDRLGIPPVTAAMLGISVQLLIGVVTWDECLADKGAWDTLFWFAALVGLADALKKAGLISAASDAMSGALVRAALPWPVAAVLLNAAYFAIHYFFASQTAHLASLGGAFMAMLLSVGTPVPIAVYSIAFNTNLNAGLTHFASGQCAAYYGSGFLPISTTLRMGTMTGWFIFLMWVVIAGLWWKVIGIW